MVNTRMTSSQNNPIAGTWLRLAVSTICKCHVRKQAGELVGGSGLDRGLTCRLKHDSRCTSGGGRGAGVCGRGAGPARGGRDMGRCPRRSDKLERRSQRRRRRETGIENHLSELRGRGRCHRHASNIPSSRYSGSNTVLRMSGGDGGGRDDLLRGGDRDRGGSNLTGGGAGLLDLIKCVRRRRATGVVRSIPGMSTILTMNGTRIVCGARGFRVIDSFVLVQVLVNGEPLDERLSCIPKEYS